jgi:hypothetical protein
MSLRPPLWKAILEEGLEDLIPLPEITATVRANGLCTPDEAAAEVSAALIALVREGLVQVWSGHWSAEPVALNPAAALEALANPDAYHFDSPTDSDRRVYYVNVDNLWVDVDVL